MWTLNASSLNRARQPPRAQSRPTRSGAERADDRWVQLHIGGGIVRSVRRFASGAAPRFYHADIVPGGIHLNESVTPLVGAKLVIV